MYGVCALTRARAATRMRVRRCTISQIAQLEVHKFNRILISLFVRHRSVVHECHRSTFPPEKYRRRSRCDNRNCRSRYGDHFYMY